MKRPHEFNTQDIANLCWSFATLRVKDVQFLKMTEKEIQSRISNVQKGKPDVLTNFSGQEISNILW